MPVEEYHRPDSLAEALRLRSEHGSDLHVVGGGTITLPAMNEGHLLPDQVIDLRSLDLDNIEESGGQLTLGATVTYSQVIDSVEDPLLVTAAEHCGSWAVRNLGTVGGNLFGPPTYGDFGVALLARDAEVRLQSVEDERWMSLQDFYTGPGATALNDDELLTAIRLEADRGDSTYVKQTRNQEPAPAVVTVAADLEHDNGTVEHARLGLNGAGPHPVRASEAEAVLEDGGLDEDTIAEAAAVARASSDPPTDALASDWYRERMIERHLAGALTDLANGEGHA